MPSSVLRILLRMECWFYVFMGTGHDWRMIAYKYQDGASVYQKCYRCGKEMGVR